MRVIAALLVAAYAAFLRTSLRAAGVLDFVPARNLFGVCFKTVNTVISEAIGDGDVAGSVEPVCYKYISQYAREAGVKTLDVMDHCAEMGGRVAEAESAGLLKDGSVVCGGLVQEDAAASSATVAAYLPVESEQADRDAFCTVFHEQVDECTPPLMSASNTTNATTTAAPTQTFADAPPRNEWDSIQQWGGGIAAVPSPPMPNVTNSGPEVFLQSLPVLVSTTHRGPDMSSLLQFSSLR